MIWSGMKSRCLKPQHRQYADYGGRGIGFAPRWLIFENFFADMGPCPIGHSIERRDNDGAYEPGNCIWATAKEQARNRRNNTRLTMNGETRCLTEWAERFGLLAVTVSTRLRRGWPVHRALSMPTGDLDRPRGRQKGARQP